MGMNPNSVMTLTQKKARFKKGTFRRKSASESQPSAPLFWRSNDDDETMPKESSEMAKSPTPMSESPASMTTSPSSSPSGLNMTSNNKFYLACLQVQIEPRFINDLISAHKKASILHRPRFFSYLCSLGKLFQHVALANADFLSLVKPDQKRLLARNTALFIQLVLGMYLSGANAQQQIYWLLGHHAPQFLSSLELKRMSIKRFNQMLNLFQSKDVYDTYKKFLKKMSQFKLNYNIMETLCGMLLFQSSEDEILLEKQEQINFFCQKYISLCEDANANTDFPRLILTLENMALCFADNVVWTLSQSMDNETESVDESSALVLKNCLANTFTVEEQMLLDHQLKSFDHVWASVSLGEDFMKECFLFLHVNEPLRKNFFVIGTALILQRYLCIMRSHQQFECLSSNLKHQLWKKNSMLSMALFIGKMETSANGIDQLQFVASTEDWAHLSALMENVGCRPNLSKITLSQSAEETGVAVRQKQKYYRHLVQEVGEMTTNPELMKLFSLLLLFHDCEGIPQLQQLQNFYLRVVFFKFSSAGNSMLGKFLSSVKTVKKLATSVATLMK